MYWMNKINMQISVNQYAQHTALSLSTCDSVSSRPNSAMNASDELNWRGSRKLSKLNSSSTLFCSGVPVNSTRCSLTQTHNLIHLNKLQQFDACTYSLNTTVNHILFTTAHRNLLVLDTTRTLPNSSSSNSTELLPLLLSLVVQVAYLSTSEYRLSCVIEGYYCCSRFTNQIKFIEKYGSISAKLKP